MPETITSPIEAITIQQAMAIVLLTMAIGLAIMLLPNRRYMLNKGDEVAPKKVPLAIGLSLIAVAVATGVSMGVLLKDALAHGLYDINLPIVPLIEQVRLSPEDQSEEFGAYVEENGTPTNTIVSMYRLTCPHCEAIYEDLDARLRAMPYQHFWVSSKSPVGAQLRDLYDVKDVPAIISFDAKGRASVALIWTTDAAGNTQLDTAALDIIEHTLQASQPEAPADDTKAEATKDAPAEEKKPEEGKASTPEQPTGQATEQKPSDQAQ